jgi:hypothetical protein
VLDLHAYPPAGMVPRAAHRLQAVPNHMRQDNLLCVSSGRVWTETGSHASFSPNVGLQQ